MPVKPQHIGYNVAVLATSSYKCRFAPIGESSLFALFPEPVKLHRRPAVLDYLGDFRLSLRDGKITARCVRWWNAKSVGDDNIKRNGEDARRMIRPKRFLAELETTKRKGYVSPMGSDLPLYIDTEGAPRDLDWDALSYDVYRGMLSRIPFKWSVSNSAKKRLVGQLPFAGYEHFESVVLGDTLLQLMRQLVEQHTHKLNGTSLVPLRWVGSVRPEDVILVDTECPMIIKYLDPKRTNVKVGALDVSFRRSRRTVH